VRFPIVTIILADVFRVAVVAAVQSIHYEGVCSYPAHLFIDVLAKVDYVKNATTVVQVRMNQVFSEAFEQGQGDLSLVHVHDSSTANSIFDSLYRTFLKEP
jgi:hypothetical protein